jgi:hypothetical protein
LQSFQPLAQTHLLLALQCLRLKIEIPKLTGFGRWLLRFEE